MVFLKVCVLLNSIYLYAIPLIKYKKNLCGSFFLQKKMVYFNRLCHFTEAVEISFVEII